MKENEKREIRVKKDVLELVSFEDRMKSPSDTELISPVEPEKILSGDVIDTVAKSKVSGVNISSEAVIIVNKICAKITELEDEECNINSNLIDKETTVTSLKENNVSSEIFETESSAVTFDGRIGEEAFDDESEANAAILSGFDPDTFEEGRDSHNLKSDHNYTLQEGINGANQRLRTEDCCGLEPGDNSKVLDAQNSEVTVVNTANTDSFTDIEDEDEDTVTEVENENIVENCKTESENVAPNISAVNPEEDLQMKGEIQRYVDNKTISVLLYHIYSKYFDNVTPYCT